MLECDATAPKDRIDRHTAQGRFHVFDGRDPVALWARPSDDPWRLVPCEVPMGQDAQHERLRRYLGDKGFSYVQIACGSRPIR